MISKKLYVDTANLDAISDIWDKICNKNKNLVDVIGITTNPNAFFKLGKNKLSEWMEILPRLCDKLSKIRKDDQGIVYVQCPSCEMSIGEVYDYVDLLLSLNCSGAKIGLKIPPYDNILKYSKGLSKHIDLNVTGLSDCSTALKCVNYGVKVVSIIPGRMEEVGIDAKAHVSYLVNSIKGSCRSNQHVIAGSMRTVDGVKWTVDFGTVPTIGEKVWALLFNDNNFETTFSDKESSLINTRFSPFCSEVNLNLSLAFFKQMDECGKQAYLDFKNK